MVKSFVMEVKSVTQT
jgi:hypothetical protein